MTPFGHSDHDPASASRLSLSRGDRRLMLIRIAIGLVQGLALYGLYRSVEINDWASPQPALFGALVLMFAYAPIALLAGVGVMKPRPLAIWIGAAAIVLALLGWQDVAREGPLKDYASPPYLHFPIMAFAAAALFIAHHLIAPAILARRWIASFHDYFDTAWKAGVQLALSLLFTGAFWVLLLLGSALFEVIGIPTLRDLLRKAWFFIPVTCVVFAIAVQLTDVREGLIRGVRTVVLMLLSWLLPVITLLVALFLAALPFTGLHGLWNTGSATAMVLSAAAAQIILINTAYQDGRVENAPPAVLKLATRIASVLLLPMIAIAFWGLTLRIGQHGLTPDRIIALACALIGAVYALGYSFAALKPLWRRRGPWMRSLERVNILAGVLTVLAILALFSPIADPARLSVGDQVKRLSRGAVSAEAFDYAFLRFESGKVGRAALERLTQSDDAAVAERAKAAQAADNAYSLRAETEAETHAPVITAWPAGSALPAAFLAGAPQEDPRFTCRNKDDCVARLTDLNGDGVDEILLANTYSLNFYVQDGEGWRHGGQFNIAPCQDARRKDFRDMLKSGDVVPQSPEWPNLRIGGDVLILPSLSYRCPDRPQAVPSPAREVSSTR